MIRFALKELLGDRSMREVAEVTNIPRGTLARLVSAEEPVTNSAYIEALCRYFCVGPERLLIFDPPIQSTPEQLETADVHRLYPLRASRRDTE